MAFYKPQNCSPWINTFAAGESKRLSINNIERPNTKWVVVNIEVKVVLENQPIL